jgi:hypothetical protein
MKFFKVAFTSMMVLIAGINGLLGGQGVATLCIHGFEFIHLAAGNHEEEGSECETHHCDGSESEGDKHASLLEGSIDCEDHCTDIELKGVDSEAPQRFGNEQLTKSTSSDFIHIYFFSRNVPTSGNIQKVPPARGPPPVNAMTELCIKKTVLRL